MKLKSKYQKLIIWRLTGILSTQILHDLFVNKSMPKLQESDLIKFDKIIIRLIKL